MSDGATFSLPEGKGDTLRGAEGVGWGDGAVVCTFTAARPTRRRATPSPGGEGCRLVAARADMIERRWRIALDRAAAS